MSKQQGQALLAELETLMLFDQSQSSKWPKVTIYVEQAGGVDQYQDEAVIIYPNGRSWNIGRSQNAPVSPEVVDALYQAVSAVLVKDPSSPTGHASRDVLRYPFRIVDAESNTVYAKWKNALEILRTVVTDTRSRPIQDGKILHEVIARFLPEDKLQDAAEMLGWVKEFAARKKEEAEVNRENAAA